MIRKHCTGIYSQRSLAQFLVNLSVVPRILHKITNFLFLNLFLHFLHPFVLKHLRIFVTVMQPNFTAFFQLKLSTRVTQKRTLLILSCVFLLAWFSMLEINCLNNRLWHMRHAIARACLCTCPKHQRYAKNIPCLIKKASRCVADDTSKTTFFILLTKDFFSYSFHSCKFFPELCKKWNLSSIELSTFVKYGLRIYSQGKSTVK